MEDDITLDETRGPEDLTRYIGMSSEPVTAWDAVESGAVRRFAQAIMDDDPLYWDEEAAAASRYGTRVAPPLYPSYAFRRPASKPDPFELLAENPDLDGTESGFVRAGAEPFNRSLPRVEVPQKRTLNGGVEAEFFSLAHHGDRITSQSRYVDVYTREGRSGPMVFVVTETTYTQQDGRVLAKVRNTTIRR